MYQTRQIVELILCIFLGPLGIHRFYAGKTKSGIVYLCTFGIFGLGWLADTLLLAVKFIPIGVKASSTFTAAGVRYYRAGIMQLAEENPSWRSLNKVGKRIYRYNFRNTPVDLKPEPQNKHDRNAIAILIAGVKVGYIKREETAQVRRILEYSKVENVSAFIGGGPYKVIAEDGVCVDEMGLSVTVTIEHRKII